MNLQLVFDVSVLNLLSSIILIQCSSAKRKRLFGLMIILSIVAGLTAGIVFC